MQESAISIFRKLPETKEQIKKYSSLVKQAVLNGEVDPLLFAAQVSALEQLFKNLKTDHLIKDVILEEAEKYGTKSFEQGNAKFQVKETGVKFDYSSCNDDEYCDIIGQINELTEKRKKREAFLKTIEPGTEVYDGNGVQLFPPVKTSTTSVSVILK